MVVQYDLSECEHWIDEFPSLHYFSSAPPHLRKLLFCHNTLELGQSIQTIFLIVSGILRGRINALQFSWIYE